MKKSTFAIRAALLGFAAAGITLLSAGAASATTDSYLSGTDPNGTRIWSTSDSVNPDGTRIWSTDGTRIW